MKTTRWDDKQTNAEESGCNWATGISGTQHPSPQALLLLLSSLELTLPSQSVQSSIIFNRSQLFLHVTAPGSLVPIALHRTAHNRMMTDSWVHSDFDKWFHTVIGSKRCFPFEAIMSSVANRRWGLPDIGESAFRPIIQ